MEKVKLFQTNKHGRDFVIGDLHGCYDDFLCVLEKLDFNKEKDRMFSVGDLVDRGPKSLECAQLVLEPSFFAVQGNHEQIMLDAVRSNDPYKLHCWFMCGGGWWETAKNGDSSKLEGVVEAIALLPLVIIVGENENQFKIVHAELPDYATTQMIMQWQFSAQEENNMLWGRSKIFQRDYLQQHVSNENIWNQSLVYCGHTPIQDPLLVKNHLYIDGGAVFYYLNAQKAPSTKFSLIIAEPNAKKVHIWNLVNKTLTSCDFNQIQTN